MKGVELETDSSPIEADAVICATAAWTSQVEASASRNRSHARSQSNTSSAASSAEKSPAGASNSGTGFVVALLPAVISSSVFVILIRYRSRDGRLAREHYTRAAGTRKTWGVTENQGQVQNLLAVGR